LNIWCYAASMPCVLNFILGAIMYIIEAYSKALHDKGVYILKMLHGGETPYNICKMLAGGSDSKSLQATSLSVGDNPPVGNPLEDLNISGSALLEAHSSFLKWMIETGVNVNGAGAEAARAIRGEQGLELYLP
jgi:hypothetical protein